MIASQKTVIDLQEKLLQSKDQELKSVHTAVTTSVSESVKAEFMSYSAAVQNNVNVDQGLTTEKLKQVVKTTVQEEDRCKNVMVFGLAEEENENLADRVGEVFEELGIKPAVELCRVGQIGKKKSTRPVKAIFSSTSTANQILSQARRLRHPDEFKSSFIRPDRSLEERASQRLLVKELIRRKDEEPEKRHFIKGSKVCSEDKSVKL